MPVKVGLFEPSLLALILAGAKTPRETHCSAARVSEGQVTGREASAVVRRPARAKPQWAGYENYSIAPKDPNGFCLCGGAPPTAK